jgi:hypothetical protein
MFEGNVRFSELYVLKFGNMLKGHLLYCELTGKKKTELRQQQSSYCQHPSDPHLRFFSWLFKGAVSIETIARLKAFIAETAISVRSFIMSS